MGRAPCCDKTKVKRGPWSPEEDTILRIYLQKYGNGGNWIALPHKAGLKRCGKSCRLRWLNYLRPDIKHGGFTDEEDNIILALYTDIGTRWSIIASHLPGRTDNDVKNYWNTKLKKKLLGARSKGTVNVINPKNSMNLSSSSSAFGIANSCNKLQPDNCYASPIYDQTLINSDDKLVQYLQMDHTVEFPFPLEVQENSTIGSKTGFLTTSSSPEISRLSSSGGSLANSYASWKDSLLGNEEGFFMELESRSSNYHLLKSAEQEISSSGGSLANSYASWNDSLLGNEEGFFMELESRSSNYHLLQSAEQEISSLSSSGGSLANSYASWNDNLLGNEEGFFREMESGSSNYHLLQSAEQDDQEKAQIKGTEFDHRSSLLNYSYPTGGSFLTSMPDNIFPSQGLHQTDFSIVD